MINIADHLSTFERWKEECNTDRERFLDWGSPLMNRALHGAMGGDTIFIAGAPNHGKSILLTSTILNLLKHNENITVIDFSVDDPYRKRMVQYLANMTSYEMNDIIYAARSLGPAEKARLQKAEDQMSEWIKNGNLLVFESTGVQKGNITIQARMEFINKVITEARGLYPNRKLILAVDAINDIDLDTKSSYSELNEEKLLAQEFNRILIQTNCLGLLSSHLRKNDTKRPTLEDLKGNSYLAYCAKVAIGIYNDAKLKHNKSDIMWVYKQPNGDILRLPILEAHFLKSKVSDYNGVICFQQWPSLGRAVEPADKETQKQYQDLVFQGA